MLSALEFLSRGLQHVYQNALLLEAGVSQGNLDEALKPEALPCPSGRELHQFSVSVRRAWPCRNVTVLREGHVRT